MSHWGIITAGDVMAEQQRTLASAQQLNTDIQNCATLDAGTRAAWQTFYAGLTAWCQTPIVNFWTPFIPDNAIVVTGDTGNTMLAWESQLTAWQQRVSKTCANVSAGLAPFNPAPSGEDTTTQWLRWGAVIVGFAATAYIVGQVARFVPTPAPRQPAPVKPAPKRPPPPPSSSGAAKAGEADEESSVAEYNPLPRRRARARRERRVYR